MATQTPNYNLDLYETGDAAALTDQYNSAMHKIDNDLQTFNQGITSASQQATNAKKVADANTAKLNALGATDNTTAAALKNKINNTETTANNNTAKLNALGATDNTTAAALKTKIDKTKNKADLNEAKLITLGLTGVTLDTATALKNKINNTETTANNNTAKLNALGATDNTTAAALKTKIDTTTNKANTNETKTNKIETHIYNTVGFNENIVVIGDSWVAGYYKQAEHINDSPANAIYDILRPATKQTIPASGCGFVANSGGGTFLDRWNNNVQNKSNVDRVIIIGGQNDAQYILEGKATLADVKRQVIATFNKIGTDSPYAHIDVFPMCLAVGESMNRVNAKWNIGPDPRQEVYNLFKNFYYPARRINIHEGAYRAGVWASGASDGGDDGDGAHLTAQGYQIVGLAMGKCIQQGTSFFPTKTAAPDASQLLGYWKNTLIFETNGILRIEYHLENLQQAPTNGNRIFQIPKCFKTAVSKYWTDWDKNKYFVAFDNTTLSLQGTTLATGDSVIGMYQGLAGF